MADFEPGEVELLQRLTALETENARLRAALAAAAANDTAADPPLAPDRTAEAFRLLADGIPTLCWMAEPDGNIYWYNQRWYDYTGTTLADMQGWGWQAVHDPEMLPVVLPRWRASIASGTGFEMTFPLRGADGVFRPFLTRIAPVRDAAGRVLRWLGTNTDVTEAMAREAALQSSEAALRQSEARLRTILDAAPVGIVIAEAPSGRIVDGNRQAEAIFGHRILFSEDVEHYREWVAHHPDGRPVRGPEYPLARALAGEERPELEALYQRGDGTSAWVRLIAAPVRTEDRITGGVVAILDIDRETRALRALAEARAGLEAQVRAEVAARQAAQARLAQAEKLSALGQLAGGVAHDFNNVLQAVLGGSRLIETRPEDAGRVRRLAQMVADAATRGASITRRLLAFSRRGDLQAVPIDVRALLEDLRKVLFHTLEAGAEIKVEAAAALPALLADKSQLQTVLINLASNARDAIRGTGEICLIASAVQVRGDEAEPPAGLAAGAYVGLAVRDTGAGMTPEVLARAAEPFFTTKPLDKGTGLGLAMARGFAEQSGGAFAIESAPGAGTTVRLWFPVASGGVAAPEPAAAAAEAAARVLLVDDDPLVREVIAEQLQAEGFAVTAAGSGFEALALLGEAPAAELLVSDLSMPGMDGLALIREAQRRRPRLPAILLTGYATDAAELAAAGAVAGPFALLRKPVSVIALAEQIAVLLGES